ncbi:MAG: glycosyltransferase [Acidobacteria bacterium]|nr:glycosyltransferase [Acidobacteriota bacterium]
MTADLWAGAEVQVATTAAYLQQEPDIVMSAVLFNEGPLARELRRLGVAVAIVDEERAGALALVRALARLLREGAVDIVHTHRYKDTFIGAAAAGLARVPHLVRTLHGLPEPMTGLRRLRYRLYEALERCALRWGADAVIAVSGHAADALRHRSRAMPDVLHISNGIDLPRVVAARRPAEVRREFGIRAGDAIVGTAGRLMPVKAHGVFLRAARIVLDERPGVSFLIVGDGPLREDLLSLASTLNVSRACIFTGARADVYDCIGAMDLFALPSLTEGTPMALLEAMALGVPVVASAAGGIPEIIDHQVNGVLVAPGDPHALARAWLDLLADDRRRTWLAARARRTVHDAFSAERSGRALVAAYRRIAALPPAARALRRPIQLCGVALEGLDALADGLEARAERRRQLAARRGRGRAVRDRFVRAARRVLLVCHGNLIRSAFAEALLRRRVGDALEIESAGLDATAGDPAHPLAVATARARGVDLGRHRATHLDAPQMDSADVIFVMDVGQLLALRRRFPEARYKTFLLTALAPQVPLEVADPILGDESQFRACFDHITRAIDAIAQLMEPERQT